ncbi:hypothetical protein [Streptomyces chrestomyceticus]|uniref:hypothetical protein n=1 Tax=Streptomyces chrestomyceticus TaxID=68185 RepID=UPI0033CB0C83
MRLQRDRVVSEWNDRLDDVPVDRNAREQVGTSAGRRSRPRHRTRVTVIVREMMERAERVPIRFEDVGGS